MSVKKNRLRAVIDLGSHSLRIFIGEVVRKGVVRQIEYLWVPVFLGNDLFSSGKISNSSISEVINILKNFQEVMNSYNVVSHTAIATSTLRNASNSETILERIQPETGIIFQIIEPITEMMIVYSGVAGLFKERYGFNRKNLLIFSLGASTSHVSYQTEGKVRFTSSSNEGTLRLVRDMNLPESLLPLTVQFNAHRFLESMWRSGTCGSVERLIAVNDDALNLIRKLKPEKEVRGIFRFSAKSFLQIAEKLKHDSAIEQQNQFGMNETILRITKVAILLIARLVELTEAEEVFLPEMAMGTSMMNWLSLVEKDYFSALTLYFKEHILASAESIGKKFHFDHKYVNRVRRISLLMFDQMQKVYGFSDQERLYLDVAVLLHNIGYFISNKAHHKNSAMLIASTEILGLRNEEMHIIAEIARYHRRALPRESHDSYRSLSRNGRMVVQRMAAILRVADGLGSVYLPEVEDLKVVFDEEICVLKVRLASQKYEYLEIMEQLIRRKSDLFEEFFGFPLMLERMIQ